MSGALKIVLMLSCTQVFAEDHVQPPQELKISVPMLGNVVLSWKNIVDPRNRTIIYWVKLKTPEMTAEDESYVHQNRCTRKVIALHRGLSVQVAAVVQDSQDSDPTEGLASEWVYKDLPPYPGVEGTAATHLSCMIQTDCSLSCSWVPGDEAPPDTQYNLYYRYSNIIKKCQEYVTESGGGRPTGCRIKSSCTLLTEPKNFLIHINGSSRSLKIQAMEKVFTSSTIELIPSVRNMFLEKKGNRSLRWMKPIEELADTCFCYEINIWSTERNDTVRRCVSSFWSNDLQKSSTKQYVRVRAVGKAPCWFISPPSSPWTEYLYIDVEQSGDMLETTLYICFTVASAAIFLLCVKFWRTIFPRIPKPRNDLKEAFQNIQNQALMRCNSWDNEEVISSIEEMGGPDKYKTSLDYGRVGDYVDCSTHKAV